MLRTLHRVCGDSGASGEAVVTGGETIFARLIGRIMRFPKAGSHPLHVSFAEHDGVERWTRRFGDQTFTSELSERNGRLVERFGALRFSFRSAVRRPRPRNASARMEPVRHSHAALRSRHAASQGNGKSRGASVSTCRSRCRWSAGSCTTRAGSSWREAIVRSNDCRRHPETLPSRQRFELSRLLRLDECEQVFVELVLVGGCQPVRCAGVDLQRRALDEF